MRPTQHDPPDETMNRRRAAGSQLSRIPHNKPRMLNPDPFNVLKWRLEHRLWDVLAYEHDSLHDEAERAKQRAAADADKLRAFWAKHPHRAPGNAEAVIAGAWRGAMPKRSSPRTCRTNTSAGRCRRGGRIGAWKESTFSKLMEWATAVGADVLVG